MPRGLAASVLQSALWTCGWDIVRGETLHFPVPYALLALRLLVLSLFVLAAFLAHTRACVRSRHRRAHTPSRRSVLGLDTDMLPSCRHRLSPRLLDAAPSSRDAAICASPLPSSTLLLDAEPMFTRSSTPPCAPWFSMPTCGLPRRRHVRGPVLKSSGASTCDTVVAAVMHAIAAQSPGSPRHWQTLVLLIHALLLTAGYERPSTPASPSVGGRAHTAPAAIWDGQLGADIREAVLVVLVVGREAHAGRWSWAWGDGDTKISTRKRSAGSDGGMGGGRASKICNAVGAPAPGGAVASEDPSGGDMELSGRHDVNVSGDLPLLVVPTLMQLLRHPILVSPDVYSNARGASRECALSRPPIRGCPDKRRGDAHARS
ncbi:hypothetical protein B0H10DRAFT_2227384 [Mycena sp. CBHHK59/15]|nr:hypothetical protein B0H10DRAFT_2227384 [Mycena sp. CBHHK59/15]